MCVQNVTSRSVLLTYLEPGTAYTVNVRCRLLTGGYWSEAASIQLVTLEDGKRYSSYCDRLAIYCRKNIVGRNVADICIIKQAIYISPSVRPKA